jgi:peptide/nickel transport system permease protein
MSPTQRYILRRLLQAIPAILGIITVNFIILNIAPGDAVDVLAGEAGTATPEYMERLRQLFGLDQPLYIQYLKYIWNVIHLDLGFSYRNNMPVSDLIFQKLPATLLLMGSCITLAVVIGVFLGVVAARYSGTVIDYLTTVVSLFCYSVPVFWVGLMMIILFSVKLGLLPTGGMETLGAGYSGFARFSDIVKHLAMPCASLVLLFMAVYTRLMRASMLEIYGLDFVRTAYAKGLSERRIAIRHVMRNALLPVVTMAGLHTAGMLGGAVVVEVVFGWPGIGRLAFDAIFARDYNLLLSISVLSSILVITVNIIIDLIYSLLDPRIEVH